MLTGPRPRTGQDAGVPASLRRRVLAVLGLTQIVAWGVLYYAFPVLAPSISADTGWSPPQVSAGFSLALVTSAAAGLAVGRRLDRRGPRGVMTAGSLLGVVAVAVIATAPTLVVFAVGWLLAGAAMAATLYPPAFAALTRWWHPGHVRALTALTLVAGFASTVFAPLTAWLEGALGWRGAYLVLAVVLAALTVPAHAVGLRGDWPQPPVTDHAGRSEGSPATGPRFVVLTVAVTLGAFAGSAALVHLVPLLLERGTTVSTAAAVLGVGGAGQVAGRLCYGRLAASTSPSIRTGLVLAALALTTVGLAVVPAGATLTLVLVAVLAGAARGLFTLVTATAVSDRWGGSHYGRLSSRLAGPGLLATAVAPWAGSALAATHGYATLFVALGVLAGVAALVAVTE